MKRRILPCASISLLALFVLTNGIAAQQKEPVEARQPETTVVLTVDYGDGVQKRFPSIPWKRSMTVLDALQWAAKHPRGIEFKKRGRAERTLVTQIDDLENQGGGRNNWIYRVNGKLADRSCGVHKVQAGDAILWNFQPYR